tara:strand:- start:2361 stop:4031 length:1671 start_codon:yes stop_codon:yes gene_type:complete
MKSKPSTVSATVSKILKRTHNALSTTDDDWRDDRYTKLNRRFMHVGRKRTSLTQRILILNLAVMILIVFFAFSAIDYTENLVSGELDKIRGETELISSSYTAFYDSDAPQNIESFLGRSILTTGADIFIFNPDGGIVFDGRLPANGQRNLKDIPEYIRMINFFFDKTRSIDAVDIPEELTDIQDIPFALPTSIRVPDIRIFRNTDKVLKVIVYRPLFSDGNEFLGHMVLIYNKVGVEEMLMKLRANMVNTVLVSLAFIALLSLFLAAYIGHPLRRLAIAAESIRQGIGKYQDIPDLSDRNDEISILSETLRAMTAELIERIDTIDAFAADVAHELKNPLTSMRSAVETLDKVKDKKKQQKLISIMLHDLERMDRLITDISKATRLDKELARERFEPVNIYEVIRDTISFMEQLIERQGHNDVAKIIFPANLNETPVPVRMSKGRIMQVLENILTNALSFSAPDDAVEISVNLWDEPKCVEIKIRDHGPGIQDEDFDRIFERFYTERREQDNFGMHSGLGLSICLQIVETHGGRIKAENHPAGGAVFTIILPIYEGA